MDSTDDQRLGRFYTPPALCRLMLDVAARARPLSRSTVWDPTCGDGAFLRPAGAGGAGRLIGTDVDGAALESARRTLPDALLRQADLFELDPGDLGPIDLILGNPPFLRAERLPPARRDRIRRRVQDALGITLRGAADTSLLALAWCARFLAPGGRLAFVMPVTALDVRAGAPLRAWLTQRFRVRLIFESAVEPWFVRAAVHTVVVVVDRTPAGPTTMVRLRRPAAEVTADGLLAPTESGPRRILPADALDRSRWSPLLRSPPVWRRVIEEAGEALVPLGDRLTLSYGTKTGISDFFAPRGPLPVEDRFVVPFLRTLRGLDRFEVRRADVRGRLLVIPDGLDEESLPPRLAAWIAAGRERRTRSGLPWPQAPSVRSHRPWWRLPPPASGPVLIPQFRSSRHHVIANPDGVFVNNSAWHGRWRTPAHAAAGLAGLNSTLAALAAEVEGRTNLGEGLLTLYGPELRGLPVPDPARLVERSSVAAAWERVRGRAPLPLTEEVARDDRRGLDRAVLGTLGVDPGLADELAAAAVELMEARQGLARRRREARRGNQGGAAATLAAP